LANEENRPIKLDQSFRAGQPMENEKPRDGARFISLAPVDDDDAQVQEIEAMFKRKLSGLRRLPRHARAHALRAAREWRLAALAALREKRARERHAKWVLWRQQLPAPRLPG
jgi:hypothetical protein